MFRKDDLIKIIFSLGILLAIAACQKEIIVDLNSSDPKIVIEAEVRDSVGNSYVKLSHSVNYYELNDFPPLSSAQVSITDNFGNNFILTESDSGYYTNPSLQGIPGRVYTLDVTYNNQNYNAISTMPDPVEIDTVFIESISNSPFQISEFVIAGYNDPENTVNFYRFKLYINNVEQVLIDVADDNLNQGEFVYHPVVSANANYTINTGDTVKVVMQSIDSEVYTYFNSLLQVNGGSASQTSPGNPQSNISNGALGFFSASSERKKIIVIP